MFHNTEHFNLSLGTQRGNTHHKEAHDQKCTWWEQNIWTGLPHKQSRQLRTLKKIKIMYILISSLTQPRTASTLLQNKQNTWKLDQSSHVPGSMPFSKNWCKPPSLVSMAKAWFQPSEPQCILGVDGHWATCPWVPTWQSWLSPISVPPILSLVPFLTA